METSKPILKIDYSDSGIKTLRSMSTILALLGFIALIASFILISSETGYDPITMKTHPVPVWDIVLCSAGIISCFILSFVLKSLAVIAENALIQKTIAMNHYAIINKQEEGKRGVMDKIADRINED